MNIDALLERYVRLRDAKDAMAERHKAELAPLRRDMDLIEQALHQMMQSQGVKQFKSAHGTAFQKEVSNARVVDFESVLDYIRTNERWDLLERRVNKTVAQELGEVPGVEQTRTLVVQVRRK